MINEIESKVQEVRGLFETYDHLKEHSGTEKARGELETVIVAKARELAQLVTVELECENLSEQAKEEIENSFYAEMMSVNEAYEALKFVHFASNWRLQNRLNAVRSALDELMMELATCATLEENEINFRG